MSDKRIDSEILTQMHLSWTPEAAATAIDQRVRTLGRMEEENFAELGLLIQEIDKHALWYHIISNDGLTPCHSLDQWIREALPWSNGAAYSALGVAGDCADIP